MKRRRKTRVPRFPHRSRTGLGPRRCPAGSLPSCGGTRWRRAGPAASQGPAGGGGGRETTPYYRRFGGSGGSMRETAGKNPEGRACPRGKARETATTPGEPDRPPPAPVLTSRRRGGVAFPGPARRRSPWERRRHEPYGDGRGAGPAPRGRPSNGSRPDLRLPLRYRARPGGTTSSPRPLQHPGLGGREPVRPGPTPFRGGVEGGPAGPWVGS